MPHFFHTFKIQLSAPLASYTSSGAVASSPRWCVDQLARMGQSCDAAYGGGGRGGPPYYDGSIPGTPTSCKANSSPFAGSVIDRPSPLSSSSPHYSYSNHSLYTVSSMPVPNHPHPHYPHHAVSYQAQHPQALRRGVRSSVNSKSVVRSVVSSPGLGQDPLPAVSSAPFPLLPRLYASTSAAVRVNGSSNSGSDAGSEVSKEGGNEQIHKGRRSQAPLSGQNTPRKNSHKRDSGSSNRINKLAASEVSMGVVYQGMGVVYQGMGVE